MDQAQGPGHVSSDHGQVTRRKVITTGVGVAGGFVLAATGSASPAMATEGSPATAARAAAGRRRPRIVLNAFEVRADTTPEVGLRVSRPGYPANVEGEGITEPDADPRVPALEEDPELRWEAYDEYWRKVHGPKHLHRDGPEDNTTHLLLRYEQQHRIPAGPTSLTPPPYHP